MRILLLFLCCLSFFSGTRPKQSPYQIEFIRLGVFAITDSDTMRGIGSMVYFKLSSETDSVFTQACLEKWSQKESSMAIQCDRFAYPLKKNQLPFISYFKNFVKDLPDSKVENKKSTVRADPFVKWLVIFTDSLHQKHYYNLGIPNLPKEINSLCTGLYSDVYPSALYKPLKGTTTSLDSIDSYTKIFIEKGLYW